MVPTMRPHRHSAAFSNQYTKIKMGLAVVFCTIIIVYVQMTISTQQGAAAMFLRSSSSSSSSNCPPAATPPNTMTLPNSHTAFDKVFQIAYERTSQQHQQHEVSQSQRQPFVLTTSWNRTSGGLNDSDRRLLGKIYYQANSVMEYGLGESTFIAAAVGVPRYLGMDSDAGWVSQARDASPSHFQFTSGDIGTTREWGFPTQPKLAKSMLLYEVMPLWAQAEAFDVYFIDGRWRPACVLLSFLHASARGGRGGIGDETSIKVGIHDYIGRKQYHRLEEILTLVEKSEQAAFFQRKPTTTDDDIMELYLYYDQLCRENLPAEIEDDVDAMRNLGC